MARQDKKLAKKRGRPATGVGTNIGVRLQPELLAAIDKWIAEDSVMVAGKRLTRPEAIRRLATEALQKLGLMSVD